MFCLFSFVGDDDVVALFYIRGTGKDKKIAIKTIKDKRKKRKNAGSYSVVNVIQS